MKTTVSTWVKSCLFSAVFLICGIAMAKSDDLEEKDFTPEFVAQCREKAEAGDVESQALYARALLNGWGIMRNVEAGMEWFDKAVNKGYADELHRIIYRSDGSRLEREDTKAAKWFRETDAADWFREAAEQGAIWAQWCLAVCYEYGVGSLKIDGVNAAKWYRKAAEQGFAKAQCRLGCLYAGVAGVITLKGIGKNATQAAEWFRKAADQGYPEAQYWLGNCYEKGEGVQKDETKAIALYRKASLQGSDDISRSASYSAIELALGIHDFFSQHRIMKDFGTVDNALNHLSKPPCPVTNDFLIGYYMEKDSRTWEWAGEERYYAQWESCDESRKIIRLSGDEGYVHLYVGALYERDRDFVEKTISRYQNNSRYVWTNGVFVTKRNLDGIKKALELIKSKSPSGRQHVTIFQVTGNHTALAYKGRRNPQNTFENRPLIHLQGSDIGKLYAEGDEIDFDKLYWASTYTYETRGGNSRTVLQLATDRRWAVRQVRDSLGLYDETDPLLGKPPKGSSPKEPGNTKNGPEENQDEETIYFGSGFFVSENGYFLTNDHVIRDAKKIEIQVGDRTYPAHRVDSDSDIDIALLKVDTKGRFFPRLAFSPRCKANLGEDVYAVGYPRPTVQGTSIKVTKGVISGLRGIMDDPRCYQIDAAIQPGNSGGPLVDAGGAVVGMAVAGLKNTESMMSSGDIAQNVNYAIKNSFILAFLDSTPECEYGIGNTTAEPKGNTSGISEEVTKACGLVISYP